MKQSHTVDRKYRRLREYVAEMADERKSLDNIKKFVRKTFR